MPDPEFSVSKHIDFLCGYLDAVGRSLSSGETLYALSATLIEPASRLADALSVNVLDTRIIENWPREFGDIATQMLRSDQKSRLMFYLIDYICWLDEFTDGATCSKLKCEPLFSDTLDQAIYHIELKDGVNILLTMYVSDKTNSEHHPQAPRRIARELRNDD